MLWKRYLMLLLPITVILCAGALFMAPDRESYSVDRLEKLGTDISCASCVAKTLGTISTTEGASTAFRILQSYYEVSPENRKNCHYIAGEIGSSTAWATDDFHTLTLTPESAICDYGFYQQYPRTLIEKTNGVESAKAFCAFAGGQLGSRVPQIQKACERAIGQSLPFLDPSLDGNVDAMAAAGVSLCNALPSASGPCIGEVYFALGRAMRLHEHGLAPAKNATALCKDHDPVVSYYCYRNILKDPIIAYATDHPDEHLTDLVADIQRQYPGVAFATTPEIVWVPAYERMRSRIDAVDPVEDALSECGLFRSNGQRDQCVRGYIVAIAKHGAPGAQHEGIIRLCTAASESLEVDATSCLGPAVQYLEGIYSTRAFDRACTEIKTRLNTSCDDIRRFNQEELSSKTAPEEF